MPSFSCICRLIPIFDFFITWKYISMVAPNGVQPFFFTKIQPTFSIFVPSKKNLQISFFLWFSKFIWLHSFFSILTNSHHCIDQWILVTLYRNKIKYLILDRNTKKLSSTKFSWAQEYKVYNTKPYPMCYITKNIPKL